MRCRVVACFLLGCGARTGLLVPTDAGHADVAQDAPHDVAIETRPRVPGCADGTREGFVDAVLFPDIAGCSGGWSVPGVMPFDPGFAPECPSFATHDTLTPACAHQAGNDSANPNGVGCDVADLCGQGFHVCASASDVDTHSASGCAQAVSANDPPLFFVTRQSSNGCGACATGTRTDPDCNSKTCTGGCAETAKTSNDVFGCGNLGAPGPITDCDPLDRFSNNLCNAVGSNWACTDDGSGFCEAFAIVHGGADFGGALCCRD